MCDGLDMFSAPTRAWFRHAFAAPTAAQRAAWPLIGEGRNVLVVAPTGSGKTLCAFLAAIDRLMAPAASRAADEDGAAGADAGAGRRHQAAVRGGVRVLYISPLKALAVDVSKNLEAPLSGIAAACAAQGLDAPRLRVATRSGDTTPKERRAIAAHPPDILVTTPESLFLMLTSKARRILATVDAVIVDEVHALAGTKRGAHLALSLERLDLLRATAGHAAHPAQRIGLSATVNPPAEAARFLGGGRPVVIVNPTERPAMDLRVVEPLGDMHALRHTDANGRGDDAGAAAVHISGVTPAMRRLAERSGMGAGTGGPITASGSAEGIVSGDGAPSVGGADASGSIWPVVERSVLDQILAHRTTLVFVNSRGLAEKLTARLNDLYAEGRGHGRPKESPEGREGFARHYDAVAGGTGQLVGSHDPDDEIAMAHHGSVAKDRRKQIEERLKRGQLRCVVATSSLELGIDMGSVDLVIQISPPLSVASGLQRVGRADHRVGGVSHALFYPLTREQIVGVAASVECMRAGVLEPLAVPRNPLDVLAQQTVAAVAMDVLKPGEWYDAVRRAAPFADLGRDMFDAVLGMLTGSYGSEEFSAFRPPLEWDHEADLVSARPGAQRLAVTSGGTIPDRGLYTVVLPEADAGKGPRRVGELDEEMVYESRVGDVITLGTSTWRIQEITRDRVIVTPAPGRTARLPFWHGDGPGRDAGFGRSLGRFLRDVSAGLEDGDSSYVADDGPSRRPVDAASSCRPEGATSSCSPEDAASSRHPERSAAEPKDLTGAPSAPRFTDPIAHRLRDDGLDGNAIDNLARLLAEQRAATRMVPSDRDLVIERCRDEEGDWRVMLHSPYGRRVHEPWAMVVDARLRRRHGFDGQAYAADDGIVVRIPEGEGRIDLRDLFLIDPDEVRRLVEEQVGQSVLFAARFRECAARSLYMPRTEPGRRVPLWQQRLRAAQLLAAARTHRNFPLLLETARECLQDVYDMPALRRLMEGLASGTVRLTEVETDVPSPFAENLLFGFVGQVMYQYDVPQAERDAQLLSMDPEVLERLLGDTDMAAVLDPDVVAAVEGELAARTFWNELPADDVAGRVARYAKTHGPFTADRMIADLGLPAEDTVRALDGLKARGELLNGRFVRDAGASPGSQWLHRDVFRRIRARSLAKARRAIRPVEPSVYQSFLLDLQGVAADGGERGGADALFDVIGQLEGVALPARTWEHEVFPLRVKDYVPTMLDGLLASGDVVWVGAGGQRIMFHPADSPLLERPEGVSADCSGYGGHSSRRPERSGAEPKDPLAAILLALLADGGAYRIDQLGTLARERLRSTYLTLDGLVVDATTGEVLDDVPPEQVTWSEEAFERTLWDLVWQRLVTNSSFTPVRARERGVGKTSARRTASRVGGRYMRRSRARLLVPPSLAGLWSLVGAGAGEGPVAGEGALAGGAADAESSGAADAMPVTGAAAADAAGPERLAIARVEALLERYGVIAQPIVDKEGVPGGFSGLYPVLRRMEEHGRLVRGMFVHGFGAAQFAERATVDALRRWAGHDGADASGGTGAVGSMDAGTDEGNEDSPNGRMVVIGTLDPANLCGSAIPWPDTPSGTVRPVRREGNLVALADGKPVLFAAVKGRRLAVFARKRTRLPAQSPASSDAPSSGTPLYATATPPDENRRIDSAFAALAHALRRMGEHTAVFTDVNGETLHARNPYAGALRRAGFVPTPQGMRLY